MGDPAETIIAVIIIGIIIYCGVLIFNTNKEVKHISHEIKQIKHLIVHRK